MSVPNYRVTTVLNKPFVMAKEGGGYEGFVVDVLTEVARQSGFNFTIYPSKDGAYGYKQPNGLWGGMIGELINKEVDIAAADLTITSAREHVVDFTKPFITQATRLLIRKPPTLDPSQRLGYLLEPFGSSVWFSIIIAIVVAALLFMLIGRFSPYEWRQVPDDKDPRGARHSFGLRDSLMFVVSTLLLQGYRETPRSLSGRTLAVSWFLFVFFIVVAYIGGVVSFVIASGGGGPMAVPFQSVEDLASQSEIQVGVVRNGRTYQLLDKSSIIAYKLLARHMRETNSFFNSTSQGLERLRSSGGRYVVLMESLRAEYIAERNCDLMAHGPSIFPSGLGFALPVRSRLRDVINIALTNLMEDGTLHMLYNRWWKLGMCAPPSNIQTGSRNENRFLAYELGIHRLAAPFILLAVGAILALVFLLAEIVFKKLRS